jgi:ElaB/YqjD/DUF883 family membrane-anchored ribosome-binding protein
MNTMATAQAGNLKDQAGNLKDDVTSQFNKGAEKIIDKATDATHDLAIDMQNLKADMASIQQTLTKLASGAGNEAYKTAQSIGSTVASQASDLANSAVSTAQGAVNSAQEQAKTFASELEMRARANPLGTIGATLVVGIVIGMLSRGRG